MLRVHRGTFSLLDMWGSRRPYECYLVIRLLRTIEAQSQPCA